MNNSPKMNGNYYNQGKPYYNRVAAPQRAYPVKRFVGRPINDPDDYSQRTLQFE